MSIRLAIATCDKLPEWEKDDAPFHRCLEQRGIDFDLVSWEAEGVAWDDYDACLIRTTWNYQDNLEAFLKWSKHVSKLTTLYNPHEIVAWNTRKTYLRDLAEKGIPIAPTLWLSQGEKADVRGWMEENGFQRGFIKPVVGATSRETLRFNLDDEGLAQAHQHLERLLPHESMMVQPYLERVEAEGEMSAILIDGQVSHTIRKIPAPGDYRVQDDFGARDEPFAWPEAQIEFAENLMSFVGQDLLYGRVDCLKDQEGRWVLLELELVEPSLFFRHSKEAPDRLAEAIGRRLS